MNLLHPKMITEKEKKALEIIRDNKLYTARSFGELYFKGMPILNKMSNIGNGATRGVGAWFHAGRILKRLDNKELIFGGLYSIFKDKYELTIKGKRELDRYVTGER